MDLTRQKIINGIVCANVSKPLTVTAEVMYGNLYVAGLDSTMKLSKMAIKNYLEDADEIYNLINELQGLTHVSFHHDYAIIDNECMDKPVTLEYKGKRIQERFLTYTPFEVTYENTSYLTMYEDLHIAVANTIYTKGSSELGKELLKDDSVSVPVGLIYNLNKLNNSQPANITKIVYEKKVDGSFALHAYNNITTSTMTSIWFNRKGEYTGLNLDENYVTSTTVR